MWNRGNLPQQPGIFFERPIIKSHFYGTESRFDEALVPVQTEMDRTQGEEPMFRAPGMRDGQE